MKELHLERKEIDIDLFKQRTALLSDVSTLIKEDTIIYHNGVPVILYKNLDIDTSALRWAVKTIPYEKTERSRGLKTQSRIFGYAPRVPHRKNYCTVTSLAEKHPKQHLTITNFATQLVDYYKEYFPDTFKMHEEIVNESVLKDWTISGTPFTSGIVNKNNQLKYHFDSGNFKDVLSNMIVFKKGTSGGFLVVPEFDIALEVSDKSLSIFNGQDILHGVSPIEYDDVDGYRYSVVYYSLQQFWKCEPVDDEIARIRKTKTEIEQKRLDPEHLEYLKSIRDGMIEGQERRVAKRKKDNHE